MLKGIVRESISKAYNKRLRKDGYLIANIYGVGLDNVSCAFKYNEYMKSVKSKDGVIFDVEVGGKKLPVVVQEYQSHPVKNSVLHVDLMVAQSGKKLKYKVPVRTMGTPIGLKNRGLLNITKKRVDVKCDSKDLPKEFMLDVTNLDVGDSILMKDLQVPSNVELLSSGRVSIVTIIKAK